MYAHVGTTLLDMLLVQETVCHELRIHGTEYILSAAERSRLIEKRVHLELTMIKRHGHRDVAMVSSMKDRLSYVLLMLLLNSLLYKGTPVFTLCLSI